jgi:hypothetical protein
MAFALFGAAVASAVLWCRWLEDHPEENPEPSDGDATEASPPDDIR